MRKRVPGGEPRASYIDPMRRQHQRRRAAPAHRRGEARRPEHENSKVSSVQRRQEERHETRRSTSKQGRADTEGQKEEQQGTHVRYDHRLTKRGGKERREKSVHARR